MTRKLIVFVIVVVLLVTAVPAFAGGGPGTPNFGEAIYADGQVFGTKGLSDLPAPNGNNNQSFDLLFSFTNGAEGQLAVAEAAPGNPSYNAGRWNLQVATWNIEPVLVKSYAEVMAHVNAGHLSYVSGNKYFECPLLPVH